MKRCTVVVLASIVLWGCDGGGGSDPITGNPVKSQSPLFSLASSKLGASGGFADVDGDGNLDAVVGAHAGAAFRRTLSARTTVPDLAAALPPAAEGAVVQAIALAQTLASKNADHIYRHVEARSLQMAAEAAPGDAPKRRFFLDALL